MQSASLSLPRPEYPRPDRQRGRIESVDWINLNGPWQFRFDPERKGLEDGWYKNQDAPWNEQIVVPFCWESLAAWGEGESAGNEHYYATRVFLNPLKVTAQNHRSAPRYEVGWYRRVVEIPISGGWEKKRIILTIGAADFFTDCWCNGVHLGHHEGGYVPFEFDLTDALGEAGHGIPRSAEIVLRVEDPMNNCEQPVGKQWGWYTPTSGIWQTVFLEPRSAYYINSFRITPDIDNGTVHFEVRCEGTVQPTNGDNNSSTARTHQSTNISSHRGRIHIADVAVEIFPPAAPPCIVVLSASGNTCTGSIELLPISLWSPDDPQLYQVTIRLRNRDGTVSDEVHSYFGMRKISTEPSKITGAPQVLCLNNEPIYLRGALYQSYHPDGVYTAREASTLRHDIAFARDMGFDFLRIHIKLDDPLVLYYADTLGLLVMQDFPNFGEGGDTPLGRQRFEEMMRRGIERDFNHPSIIAWCIFNESWGFGGQTELIKWITPNSSPSLVTAATGKFANVSSFTWIHQTWLLAKSLDPTRLIEDMSVVVWDHVAAYGHVDTDINSWHFYIDDYYRAKSHIAEVIAKTYHGSSFNYVEGYSQRSAPLINSEFGGVGALDGDRDISWSFKFLTNELRRHGHLSAYIFTELTDVEWEHNGFLNYDRTEKEFGYPPTIVNQADVLPIDAPPIVRLSFGTALDIEVRSSHFSRASYRAVMFHWDYSGIDTLGSVHLKLMSGNAPIPFTKYAVEVAGHPHVVTPSETMLCTLSVKAISGSGAIIAENFIQHFVCEQPPAEREVRSSMLILRRRVKDWDISQWSGAECTREQATESGSCHGQGAGFFEWVYAEDDLRALGRARRVRLLVEVSACRSDIPQTDGLRYPTHLEILINGIPIHRSIIPDHPHDSRGALSYLRGGRGAYGYLVHVTIEGAMLNNLASNAAETGVLRMRCAVNASPEGGLTIYEYDCGRMPIGPTVIVEWE